MPRCGAGCRLLARFRAVAAAGNRGPHGAPAYPAAYDTTFGITAVDSLFRPYRRANRGDYLAFAAMGVDLALPDGDGRRTLRSGTSFASAMATGAVLRLLSGNRLSQPGDLPRIMRIAARDLGAPGKDPIFGWGILVPTDNCETRQPKDGRVGE